MKTIKVFQNESYKELVDLYGLFFEDINHAADGGLYAELVQNRSFEYCEIDRSDYTPFTAWDKSDDIKWEICTDKALNEENVHYLRVEALKGSYIRNVGYNSGIYVEAGKNYEFSMYLRSTDEAAALIISIEEDKEDKENKEAKDNKENICARATVEISGHSEVCHDGWKRYEITLKSSKTTCRGRLCITFEDAGIFDLDMVSLFPQDTFMGRKNGLRKDIAEALKEMQPKFMRFPGGCLTHDGSLDDHARNSMYRWRRTIGKIEERPTWRNNWRYNQTLGLGFYEYFCFCEDIGAKPLPVLPGGFNPHKGEGVPIEEIDEWVQETLDLIEFANGSAEDTKWGRIRAEMGHKEPFNMEYLGIGNEEIGEGFFERYPYFHNAVRSKYPEIKIINTAGPFAVGEGYEAGWSSAKKYGSDMIDEHYYSSPEWFLANMHHYDDYDENGPKVFLGEYASWGNTYYNALVEAAYMTHLERTKAVALACYAPMLCNIDYVNWQPNMLWFNNHEIMKTPNYYVQKMFMQNQGTDAVRFELDGMDEIIKLSDKENISGNISVCGNDIKGKLWDIKIIEKDTLKTHVVPDVDILNNDENVFGYTESREYTLEFKFKRSAGRKGLKIYFGKTDDKNYIQWEFGGWDNWDCNISSYYNGRSSAISHRIFHVEDIEYTLRLEVSERSIRTYINGELYNETADRLPELEELYVTAAADRTMGRTIIKAVNLTGEAKRTGIILEGGNKTHAEVTVMKNHPLDACNTFEEPDKVAPTYEKYEISNNSMEYEFAPHSVCVMVFS